MVIQLGNFVSTNHMLMLTGDSGLGLSTGATVAITSAVTFILTLTIIITSQNTMYCGGEPEASYTKRHIAYIF